MKLNDHFRLLVSELSSIPLSHTHAYYRNIFIYQLCINDPSMTYYLDKWLDMRKLEGRSPFSKSCVYYTLRSHENRERLLQGSLQTFQTNQTVNYSNRYCVFLCENIWKGCLQIFMTRWFWVKISHSSKLSWINCVKILILKYFEHESDFFVNPLIILKEARDTASGSN